MNILARRLHLNFLSNMNYIIKTLVLSFTTLLTLNAFGQDFIIGKWRIIDQGDTGYFEFDKDGFAKMIMDGEEAGGKYFLMDETPACVKYSLQKTGEIYHLNLYIISLANKDSTIITIAPGILKPDGKDKYLFNINFEHSEFGDLTEQQISALRPKDFKENDETVTLTKVK